MKCMLATHNIGKRDELLMLLPPNLFKYGLTCLPDNYISPQEVGISFLENALIKARYASSQYNAPALADDSGLCVPVLGYMPGIFSARYDEKKKQHGQLLLKNMEGMQDRQAFFYCCLVFVRFSNDPVPIVAEGCVWGEIAHKEMGEYGFGYDNLFYLPSYGKVLAECLPEVKNQISHRALACQNLVAAMQLATGYFF